MFFQKAFAWSFVDYGSEYTSFSDQGLDGGFFQSELKSESANGAALLVLLTNDIDKTLTKVQAAGGKITQDIFEFPGGKRFHFTEPSGNELAVWAKD